QDRHSGIVRESIPQEPGRLFRGIVVDDDELERERLFLREDPLGAVDHPRIVLHRHDDGDANSLGTHTDETREQTFKSISPAPDQMGGRPVAGAARVFYEEIWRRKVREGPRPEDATADRKSTRL